MELYQGIKFCISKEGENFPVDERLERLNRWVHIQAELGLAPVHAQGAYGNHSFRVDADSFVITRTGMRPGASLEEADYCLVRYDNGNDLFTVRGRHEPSSESFLHHLLYQRRPEIGAIMHGHCDLLTRKALGLGLVVTEREYPYGTRELAEAALEAAAAGAPLFILRNHGFVALGRDIEEAASRVLAVYRRLIDLLAAELAGRR